LRRSTAPHNHGTNSIHERSGSVLPIMQNAKRNGIGQDATLADRWKTGFDPLIVRCLSVNHTRRRGKMHSMKILVTAGNTQAPIDRVRCITNIFTGRTGTGIALHALGRGHAVTLLTSHPEILADFPDAPAAECTGWTVCPYRTFDDLAAQMASQLGKGGWNVVIHCAAVSDYQSGGIFGLAPGTRFDPASGAWSGAEEGPRLVDRAAGKVKSDEPELWLRLVRAPKLVDRIRTDWGFTGILVKFKLEVGKSDEQLLDIAEKSRRQSHADWMVANTLEGAAAWAYLGPFADGYRKVTRPELPGRVLDAVESSKHEVGHG